MRMEDIKRLEASEKWIWRRMERISWTEHIMNEEVLQMVGEERAIITTISKRQWNWIVTYWEETLRHPYDGNNREKNGGRKGRGRQKLLDWWSGLDINSWKRRLNNETSDVIEWTMLPTGRE
jgi:hypothetical protein